LTAVSLPSLADQAISRLQKIAAGNGLAPDQVTLTSVEENLYIINGVLSLTPKNDIQKGRYPGKARGGKDHKILPDMSALQMELKRYQEEFQKGGKWINDSVNELKNAPGQGWGLEGAYVTAPDTPVVLATTMSCQACQGRRLLTCPQCNGQGHNTCPHCQGSRQEPCSACNGTGHNPAIPEQVCSICNGSRIAGCRFCRASGQLACPTCHGRRGIDCTSCKGTGQITEEIAFTCGAETHFRIVGEGLPSGLRRGLDRLGIVNLTKGHADIETITPKSDEAPPDAFREATKGISYTPALYYRAQLPYADLRVRLGPSKSIISAFGKKCVLLGVPAFLDDVIEPWRDKLKQATLGKTVLEAALEVRVIRDALALDLNGKGQVFELRRKYPLGLSPDVTKEIMTNIRLAINRYTLRIRTLVAVTCSLLSTLIFTIVLASPLRAKVIQSLSSTSTLMFDIIFPMIITALSWVTLNASTRFVLKRRFRNQPVSLHQKLGKTGHTMLAVIVIIYLIIYATARP
jgi:hypothetical protein